MQRVSDLGRPVEGILWMVACGISFVGVNGIVRYLGTDLPAAQSAFIRFAFGLLILSPALWRLRRPRFSRSVLWLFGWRGALHVVAVIFWFHAMARVPVAEMAAIGFLNPVLVLLIAGLLLGEGLSLRRSAVTVAALIGAFVVLRPGFREVTEGHLAQIAATVFFASSYICAKRLSISAPASAVVAILSVTVTIGLAPIAWWVWEPVRTDQVAWLALVALLATAGHYAMARAFSAAPLAVTQPVTFLQLVWSTLLGALAFGDAVDGYVLLGGSVIILAISINAWTEGRDRIPVAPES